MNAFAVAFSYSYYFVLAFSLGLRYGRKAPMCAGYLKKEAKAGTWFLVFGTWPKALRPSADRTPQVAFRSRKLSTVEQD
jgi:hypothetical protein